MITHNGFPVERCNQLLIEYVNIRNQSTSVFRYSTDNYTPGTDETELVGGATTTAHLCTHPR